MVPAVGDTVVGPSGHGALRFTDELRAGPFASYSDGEPKVRAGQDVDALSMVRFATDETDAHSS
jgi:hypothetical protein